MRPVDTSPVHSDLGEPLLRAERLSKSFGATQALRDVSLSLYAGRVLAVAGENGAGKSTLVKVLAGLIQGGSYTGAMYLAGRECHFRSIAEAEAQGIALIQQELQPAPGLSVAENMLAGHLPTRYGFVDSKKMVRVARQWLDYFELEASPTMEFGRLRPSEQRLAVIGAALSRRARVLILDEPTVSLTRHEIEKLFGHIRQLRDDGTGIIYITHALDEIEELADDVLVLRNGARVANFAREEGLDRDSIVRTMLGRALQEAKDPTSQATKRDAAQPPMLRVEHLSVRGRWSSQRALVDDVSFGVAPGEILGLFGAIGSGAPELAAAIYGVAEGYVSGSLEIGGVRHSVKHPRMALSLGIAMLNGDRQALGIIQGHSVSHNISVSSIGAVVGRMLISTRQERERNERLVAKLHVVTPSLEAKIEELSGGNQQKALLARCFAVEPRLLILEEPTLGVDIGSRAEIYLLLRDLVARGAAVLLVSSDVGEVASQCDRILVFRKGKIVAERARGEATEVLMQLAIADGEPSETGSVGR